MQITVTADGWLNFAGERHVCALGRAGVVADKREGDWGTPVGTMPLRCVYFRPDRLPRPDTALPVHAVGPSDGWCDDPADANYNRPVKLPYPASAEPLWRDDHRYDLIVPLGWNDDPPVPGCGSAIFLHVAPPEGRPTAGCIGLPVAVLLRLLTLCDRDSVLTVKSATGS